MGWQAWLTLGSIGAVFAGLAAGMAPDALLIGAVVFLGVVGIVTPEEVFSGFGNTGMLTVAALYVVTAGLRETGALRLIGAWALGKAETERGVLVRMSALVTSMSALLNNTPIVAMFIPILETWCRKHRVSPSRLLIPLSYLAILGGTCTLIGTSTNLVVNGLMEDAAAADPALQGSLRSIGMFELGYVGVPYALVGVLYLMFVGTRLLPRRATPAEQLGESPREYLADMRIEAGCSLVGQNVQEAGLRHLDGLFLIEIVRREQVIAPVGPDQLLEEGDILTFTGVVSMIVDLERIPGLLPVADAGYEAHSSRQRERRLCEAVVSRSSPLNGKTIRDANFRALYNAAVVAVHRGRERLGGRVGDIVLQPGDTLLLQAGAHFSDAHRNNPDFFLVSGVEDSRPLRHDKSMISLVLLLTLVVLMSTGVISVVLAAFLVAGAMIVTRCISVSDARQSVDWQTLLTIAAAFGLGRALVKTGCVGVIAGGVVESFGGLGPQAVLVGVYLTTTLFTEVVTNNAAAALMFPFAVALAGELGVDPRPFVMTITFAASASFITPLGYQTNLMVYAPGGYRLTDFVRIGLPLNLLMMTVATLLIPWVWPF